MRNGGRDIEGVNGAEFIAGGTMKQDAEVLEKQQN